MKKLWIIYLFFVAFLLTGCGQMTKVEKELSKRKRKWYSFDQKPA